MRFCLLFLFPLIGLAQTEVSSERIRAAMQASIERQMASVRLQEASFRRASTVPIPQTSFAAPPKDQEPAAAPAPIPAAPVNYGWDCSSLREPDLTTVIQAAAEKQSVRPSIVRAVIEQESAGHPCAVSKKGAQGLMQLMPATSALLQVSDPFDVRQNVDGGTKLLRSLLDRYGNDLSLALGAYNAGAARVDKAGGIPNIAETQGYVSAILERVRDLERQ